MGFPLMALQDGLLQELVSHCAQSDRLSMCLVNKRLYRLVSKLIYRRIYLNDSNVVRSDYMNLAVNWTLFSIPSFLNEDESRAIANKKLEKLIQAFHRNPEMTLHNVQWIRINWDLDPLLQKQILNMLCANGRSLQRLENVIDPSCNDIIALGEISSKNVTSFDMAPPNSLPELMVPQDYIPNLSHYLRQRISSKLSHMTLFIDPIKLFNYLYPLSEKLQIIDLKLHWRREFFPHQYFCSETNTLIRPEERHTVYTKLSEVFDVRTLKILTIISWNESLMSREIEIIEEFKEFTYLEDLSLISIKQDIKVLVSLFGEMKRLKRLKMDFLEDYVPEPTSPQIFLAILLNCKDLQFIDLRFEGVDLPIIHIQDNKFEISQKCFCNECNYVFENILKEKIFHFPEDYELNDIHDIAAKDIFKMMRYFSLLPYSKACDCYPSVRTQPMNLTEFVVKMNENLLAYRQHRSQLQPRIDEDHEEEELGMNHLPHEALSEDDVINCYHSLVHHFKSTYITFLRGFPKLRFLMLNDIPTITVEENGERIFQPIFNHYLYTTNLTGWSKQYKKNNNTHEQHDVTKRATVI
ncbi:SCF ubiquitin ligase complex subunit DAS1 RNJ42_00885 [Nakaseomyces bracarensis]|uniref:SCF ubiquitin ligase complex subunit DAS1 n=1 Tax=Nakaseomyces bracarensis TaxID=273131 RepID=UPI0038726144